MKDDIVIPIARAIENDVVIPLHMKPANVPCGTCKLCCKKTLVMLLPQEGDIVESYERHQVNGAPFLRVKDNGDCWYLGDDGCTIHDRAPYLCRTYDCRQQHAMYTREQRRKMIKRGLLNKEVLQRGNELIRQGRDHANDGQREDGES